jgi:hypothetical protein
MSFVPAKVMWFRALFDTAGPHRLALCRGPRWVRKLDDSPSPRVHPVQPCMAGGVRPVPERALTTCADNAGFSPADE